MKRLAGWTALLLVLFAGAAAPVRADEIRVVLTPRSVPFSYYNDAGALVGFNVDIVRAICAELQRDCRIETLPFPEIVPAVADGRFDLGVANLLRTPEREKAVAFTMPYWRSTSVFVGRAGIPVDDLPALLRDRRTCAIEASGQWRHLHEQAGAHAHNLRALPANQDVLDALHAGECEVALLPTMQVLTFLQGEKGAGLAFLGAPLGGAGLGGPVHMIVRPDAPALRDAVDRALRRLIANGEHERAARRYFPFSIL